MIYRAAVTFVWLFWIVMVALLVRSEYFPEHASLYQLPISYVGRKIFTSDTGSDMAILYKQIYVGKIFIEPSPTNERVLKGNIRLNWPVLGKAVRAEIFFSFTFNPKLEVEEFNINSHSEDTVLNFDGSRLQDRIDANFRINGSIIEKHFKWSEMERKNFEDTMMSGVNDQLGLQQLPPALIAGSTQELRWYAASANLTRHDRKVDALLIATEGNRDYWVKIWVTPSGEILFIQTSPTIGITLENRALMEAAS